MGERVLKEGYLIKSPDVLKHLNNPKKWQRKWFSLDSSGDLSFFDSEKSSKPSGLLHLWKCSVLFDPKTKNVQHLYCIGLDFGDYTTFLKAESASAFNDWLRVLRDAVKNCELEEVPERHGTVTSLDQFAGRSASVSSTVQPRNFSISTQSKFQRKEGYMSKTGGNNKGWKDRYFVLSKGGLSYYKSERGVKNDALLGTIDLFECSKLIKTSGKKGYGFDLQMPSRVYNLSTETESELVGWVDSITHTLEVIGTIKGASPGSVKDEGNRHSTGSSISGSSLDKMLEGAEEEEESERTPPTTPASHSQEHSLEDNRAVGTGGTSGQEDKDSVVQLLEVEVEALHSKISSLEADLRSSSNVNSQLQEQLVKERKEKNKTIKGLEREREDLTAQVEQLEGTKEGLETINDSIQTQLEEQQDKTQVLEEEQIALKQELDEVQNSSNAMEEELADTQTKLQEIEEVAHNLEEALRKRADSEPPPDLSSLRSLNRTYKAKMAEELSSSAESPLSPTAMLPELVSQEVLDLRGKVAALETTLQQQQQHLDDEKPLPSVSAAPPPEAAEHLVHEERLKWQVEVVNIRRELDGKLEEERRGWAKEREELKKEVGRLEKDVAGAKSAYHQVGKLQAQLEKSQERVEQLEGEVNTASGKVTQLLIEKEKALADLKTIRKTNRTMEKKMSETEEVLRSASRGSMSGMGSPPDRVSPALHQVEDGLKLMEAERKVVELQTQLSSVEKERDALKQQLEELRSKAATAAPVPPPAFDFFNKTSATVGTSRQAVGGQARAAPSTAGLRNGWATASTSYTSAERPPPKPKKPPKELVDRFSMSTNSGNTQLRRLQPLSLEEGSDQDFPSPSIRSRTKSMFQSFFARR